MGVNLGHVKPHEWDTTPAPSKVYPDGHQFTTPAKATLEYLRPGRKYRIDYQATATGQAPRLIVHSTLITLTPGQATTGHTTAKADRPIVINLAGIDQADIDITITDIDATEPKDNSPAQTVTAEVFAPVRGRKAFYVGQSRLSVDALTRPNVDVLAFRVGLSRLGQAILNPKTLTRYWTPISDPATEIEISRGIDWKGVTGSGELGSVGIKTFNGLDPRAMGLTAGTPLRVYHWPTRTPIFIGKVTNYSLQPDKDGNLTALIQGVDQVAELAGRTHYGFRTRQAWPERIAELMEKAGMAYILDESIEGEKTDIVLEPTVYESNYVNHLDLILNSIGGYWSINVAGRVRVLPGRQSAKPSTVISDQYLKAEEYPGLARCYFHTAQSEFDSSNLVNALNITLKSVTEKPDGQLEDKETVLGEITEPTSVATFGASPASLTMNCDTATALKVGHSMLASQPQAPALKSVTFNAMDYLGAALGQEVSYPVACRFRGENTALLVTTITHQMTAQTWNTTYQLAPERKINENIYRR